MQRHISIEYHPFNRSFDPEQSLMISQSIQTAFEQEIPLSVIYRVASGMEHQFCGYVDQIDPYERWLQLRNGVLYKRIFFTNLLQIDLFD
ncbi:hypothetical protein SAMN05444392_11442 [Seinonella peptonophila]|uniref:YolD-like protein n=1 Tax=Seinonella peptonophila TaxID=112248 RepID=A0A1M5AJS4_9BACL|nr:hypothetical protein [Seinonella peptonophila]SHF30377.1 hypothetical protein SAMN05444392_11442 [Seinonella peptonophila]